MVELLQDAVADVLDNYHHLVLLVGPISSGKSATLRAAADEAGWPTINVNLVLADGLLDLDPADRVIRCKPVLSGAISMVEGPTVGLDNVEILFEKHLQQDALRLFQSLSRSRTLVVNWPGTFDGKTLTFGDPGHRDYCKYTDPAARIITQDH